MYNLVIETAAMQAFKMTTTNHAQTLCNDKISQLEGSIKYCDEALASQGLEKWEEKEYRAVKSGDEIELVAAKCRLQQLREI